MFSIVILAAGLGKRMGNPDIPKVLAELNDKPIIYYVLNTALALNPNKIALIVGHQRSLLIDYVKQDFSNVNIEFAIQEEQLGTGHAVKCTKSIFENVDANILILSGDVPLLKVETLHSFMNLHLEKNADISVLSAYTDEPQGYGRIVRNEKGDFAGIVEEKDADENIKTINEINSGIYCLNSKLLFDLLEKINNDNNQNEYYLTDIISIAKEANRKVLAYAGAAFQEIQGINTPKQLEIVAAQLTANL